jgi:transcriptional antiterminator RfaH
METILLKKDFFWFTLFTMPNHEKIVCGNLNKIGIESFLPMRKEMRQWSDRKMKVEVPYFPNYLFVNIRKVDRYKVFEVPGVVRYLDSNQNPTVMREKEINIIKTLESAGKFEVTSENFSKGDLVVITSGPLKNLQGVLIDKKGTKRLLLQIESIKRNLLVDVAAYSLKKIHEVGVLKPVLC